MEIVKVLEGIPKGYSVPKEYQDEYEKLQLDQRREKAFGKYQSTPTEEEQEKPEGESPLGYATRTTGRTLARAGESILGSGGDLLQSAQSIANWVTGNPQTSFRESALGRIPLPTSGEIKENITKPLTGEYLEPQSKGEQKYDDIIDLTSGLLLGSPSKLVQGGLKGATKYIAQQAGKAITADALGTGAEMITGSPYAGGVVRAGTLLATSLFGGKGHIKKVKSDNYATARNIAQEKNYQIKAPQLEGALKRAKELSKRRDIPKADKEELNQLFNYIESNIPKSIKKGGGAKALEQARKTLKDQVAEAARTGQPLPKTKLSDLVKETSKPGTINTPLAMDMLTRVNARYPLVDNQTKPVLSVLNGALNENILSSGKSSKDFTNAFKTAQEIAQAEKAVPKILKTINDNITFEKALKQIKPASYLLGSIGHVFGRKTAANLVGGLAGALTAKELANFAYLLKNSPRAYNEWKNFILAGAKKNTGGLIKSFKALDKEAAKYNL